MIIMVGGIARGHNTTATTTHNTNTTQHTTATTMESRKMHCGDIPANSSTETFCLVLVSIFDIGH